MTAAALMLLWTALGGVDGTAIDAGASGKAETSARSVVRDAGGSRQLAVTDVTPILALHLDRRALRLALRWEPQLRLSRELGAPGSGVSIGQGATGRAEWDLGPVWHAAADARALERLLDFVAPSGTEIARLLDLRVPPATIRFRDAGVSAGVEGRLTPLDTLRSSVAMSSSTGVGAEGRAAMPGFTELRLGAGLSREATRVDVLRGDLALATGRIDAVGTASLATATAGWSRRVTRTLRLGAAAALSGAQPAGGGGRLDPGGQVELEATPALLGRPARATAALKTGPALDRYGLGVQDRLGVEGAFVWALAPRWTVTALAAAARVREVQGYSAARADLRAAWRAGPRVTLTGGLWREQQRDPHLGAAASASFWGVSLGAELLPLPKG